MLQNDKILRYQTIALSLFVSLVVTLGFTYHEYNNLKNRINTDILPSVVMELDSLTNKTQTQFRFLRYTALKHDALSHGFHPMLTEAQPALLKECLDQIDVVPENKTFSNRTPKVLDQPDSRNGILSGKGDISSYSTEALNLLCTVIMTSSANSEVIRLVKPHPIMNYHYYFVAKDNNYIFLFNHALLDTTLNQNIDSEIRKQYEKTNSDSDFWISTPYMDTQAKTETVSLVQNITDFRNQVIGFFVRDLYTSDLEKLIRQTLSQRDRDTQLMDYGQLTITNNKNVIFSHSPHKKDVLGQNILSFEDTQQEKIASDFGPIHAHLQISMASMVKLIFEEQRYLLFMPFLILIFSYTILQQMLRGLRESDKQYYDSLTKTFNRHGLHQKVYKKIDKAINNNKNVHIFSIDANKFKHINDKYGHDIGDKAIKLIASGAQHICKPYDDIVRLGGDEFLVVLYTAFQCEFDPNQFMQRFNQKLAYDCKENSIPHFTLTGGHVVYSLKSHQTLSQAIRQTDKILLTKKSIDKIDTICEEFDSFDINLSSEEHEKKLLMLDKLAFVQAESLLQSELNEKVLSAYRGKLSYLISNYFHMIYSCRRENDDLHNYRMKIVESHYKAGIPMSVFYFLFVKYGNFLMRDVEIDHDEFVINNRLMSYELHFMSSLKTR